MREVAPQNNVCFTRFSSDMKQIQEKSENQNNLSNPNELITYQKRKREAADEGIKSVCWWVLIFNFMVNPYYKLKERGRVLKATLQRCLHTILF